jgi:hypothetical protein
VQADENTFQKHWLEARISALSMIELMTWNFTDRRLSVTNTGNADEAGRGAELDVQQYSVVSCRRKSGIDRL